MDPYNSRAVYGMGERRTRGWLTVLREGMDDRTCLSVLCDFLV